MSRIEKRYGTCKAMKEAIDPYLIKNAVLQANIGTESTEEERQAARDYWNDVALPAILKIDPTFSTYKEE